jgi:hypothetical protein
MLDRNPGDCLSVGAVFTRMRDAIGKETDRRWEQGEDPSMLDSDIYVYEKRAKLVVVDVSERKRWLPMVETLN